VHIAIDDGTRLAYAEVLPDEKATSAIGFLRRAIAFYRRHEISVERFIRTVLAGWAYGALYGSTENAPRPLTAGYGPTTIAADTQPSAANRPSHG
jgi:hypothetical protein